jgi:hypothetical protein
MAPALLAWPLLVGSAAIALWIAARFPTMAPRTATGVSVWVACSFASTFAAPVGFTSLDPLVGRTAALLIVAVTSGVCVMLTVGWASIWVIRSIEPSSR